MRGGVQGVVQRQLNFWIKYNCIILQLKQQEIERRQECITINICVRLPMVSILCYE